MSSSLLTSQIGERIFLRGHFDVPVVLEDTRPLGSHDWAGYACRVRLSDGSLQEAVISAEEVAAVLGTGYSEAKAGTPVDAEKLRLFIESARVRLAYAHDQQFAVSLSGIRTLPHQIEAVYQAMLPEPRLRFLLADDPGAGKTIMAGLLVKELKLREAIDRILILCPAPLTIQWQDEMLRWFSERFDIIFSAVEREQLTNPWQRSSQIIASIDDAKREDDRERVWQQRWDLVIIDEAHECSARTASGGQNRESKVATTKRYDLASRLTSQADHVLLLLTATPHHGDEDKFAHFLRLIDPDLLPEPHRLGKQPTAIRKDVFRLGKDSPWSLRRLKEDLKDANGKRPFPDRHTNTVTFCLNNDEYALYKSVTAYINAFIPQQTGQRRSWAALTRTVLQRRLASSTCAIHESIKRRLKRQEDLLDELEGLTPAQGAKRLAALQGRLPDAEQDEDDLDDAVRDQLVDAYTAALELEQLRAEISALKELVEQARRVRENANDSKLAALKKCLGEAQFMDLKDGRGKLLIFTEHRDTLGYVRDHLVRWGFSTCEIHGGMNPHERRRAQEVFRTGAQVCIATEAAGEGINLQFCHLMINYDMPWNPTRLEQQLGRIHRIGQQRDCFAFNFVATDSEDGQPIVEGRILHRFLEKLDQMNEALEGRVFDVIGGAGFFVDSLCREPYRIHLLEISIRGKGSKGNDVPLYGELVAVREERGHYEVIPSDILLELGFDIRAHKIADEATGDVFVKRIEVKGRLRGQPIRLTTNEWYKAQQLVETYWLYAVWGPLSDSPELVRMHSPFAKLDHAKRGTVAARFYEIPAGAIQQVRIRGEHDEIYR